MGLGPQLPAPCNGLGFSPAPLWDCGKGMNQRREPEKEAAATDEGTAAWTSADRWDSECVLETQQNMPLGQIQGMKERRESLVTVWSLS